ncbi:uncharacterized protein LOC111086788 [Limulus polyphemus]|uniref:Uncharacterized protein LOC111086788 n=1 Tax=Limulus polyphemus TaxID=6850 RepID=A0ABM1ST06_LIMPO|nr:uncharacterized protein LOC111086788 [Limulus polyphemus]XP_022246763.1 uncharacterized protein LOC111086788 [Limulus polyphemus]XP_022246764.1 uncharacterized protein LOC111086788 [Limulus polyphemus]XP_022246765.1 uncharacterized protein LOC111086788 [Limulus polyphemus]XP_022246766.1 uncharacterized protein LOC111086788 [Limulus polyphemus]
MLFSLTEGEEEFILSSDESWDEYNQQLDNVENKNTMQTCPRGDQKDDLITYMQTVSEKLTFYLKRNEGNEDYCEVYENKYQVNVSGLALYHADLLAMAQVNDETKSLKTSKRKSQIVFDNNLCDWPCSGKCNPELGLGPLGELFKTVFGNPSSYDPTIFQVYRPLSDCDQDVNSVVLQFTDCCHKTSSSLRGATGTLQNTMNRFSDGYADPFPSCNLNNSFTSGQFPTFTSGTATCYDQMSNA